MHWTHLSVTCWVGRMAWSSSMQKKSKTAIQSDSDGTQLRHCDVGIMLGALVGNVLGRQDGLVVWLAEGEQDSHPVGTAVGGSDGEQLGHCDVGIMLGALVGISLGVDVSVALGALAVR